MIERYDKHESKNSFIERKLNSQNQREDNYNSNKKSAKKMNVVKVNAHFSKI